MKTSELMFTFTFIFREDSLLSSTKAITSELVLLYCESYYVVICPLFAELIINVSIYALFDDIVNIF